MKKLTTIFILIVLFHQFTNGSWIFGFAVPEVISIVMDSNGQCQKWDGEQKPCELGDKYLLISLKKMYEKTINPNLHPINNSHLLDK